MGAGSLTEHDREIVNATIADIFENIDEAMSDVIGSATNMPVSDNFVTSIPAVPRTMLMQSPMPPIPHAPSLPIPPQRMSGIMFPPPPALPIPRRRHTITSLEYELSNIPAVVPPDSSDDDD